MLFTLTFIGQNPDDKIDELTSNKELYKSFTIFFNDSIKQETTENIDGEIISYYYKVDQVNGVNYFDFNNDGNLDALVECSVNMSGDWKNYFLIAVLFKNINGTYKYIAHIDPNPTRFKKHQNSIFFFSGAKYIESPPEDIEHKKYKLVDNQFIEQIK